MTTKDDKVQYFNPDLGVPYAEEFQRRLNEALLEAQHLRNEEQRYRVEQQKEIARKARLEADNVALLVEHNRRQLDLPRINTKDEGKA